MRRATAQRMVGHGTDGEVSNTQDASDGSTTDSEPNSEIEDIWDDVQPSQSSEMPIAMQKDGLVEKDFFDMVSARLPDTDQARKFGVDCLRSVRIAIDVGDSGSTVSVGGRGTSLD
ncbi:hypothetical protein AAF712_014030 [Marasmius tenuissimus]|uniref:Uncharacterized protein n=1 Tax=Marasmius tenuissimus TaxID=585030 RepID=A0ABR2ZC27_9AGAR